MKAPVRWTLAAQLAACVLALACLRMKWPTFRDFVLAIDHGDVVFADFVNHYYPTVAESLRHGAPAGGFFYPAGFAAMMAPIGLFSLAGAKHAWSVVLGASFGVVVFVLVREAAKGRPVLAALGAAIATTSIPVLHDVKWGQVSLPILAAAGGAFVLATLAALGGLLDGRRWARPLEVARVASLALALVAWTRVG